MTALESATAPLRGMPIFADLAQRQASVVPAIRIVSLFAGLGGADMGAYLASMACGVPVEIVLAVDSWEPAVKAYNRSLPHPVATVADVKAMRHEDLPEHDLVIGGPPCQPFSMAGKRLGFEDERDCIPDFIRLTRNGKTPFIMENVVGGLLAHYGIEAYEMRLQASDFGDVTSRKRHFYTNIAPWGRTEDVATLFGPILRVVDTPRPRTFGDIRDPEADQNFIARARAMRDRRLAAVSAGDGGAVVRKKGDTREVRYAEAGYPTYESDDLFGSLTAHAWHGHDERSEAKLVAVPLPFDLASAALPVSYRADGSRKPMDEVMADMDSGLRKAAGQSEPTDDDGLLCSITSGHGGVSGYLKVKVHGLEECRGGFVSPEAVLSTLTETSYRSPNRSGSGRANQNTFAAVGMTSAERLVADQILNEMVETAEGPISDAVIDEYRAFIAEEVVSLRGVAYRDGDLKSLFVTNKLDGGKVPIGDYSEMMANAIRRGRNVETVGECGVLSTLTSRSTNGITGGRCLVTVEVDDDKSFPRNLLGVRCPSLMEMSRAHSIPDEYDYAGASKDKRGKMIANCWPVGMAQAVMTPVLQRLSEMR